MKNITLLGTGYAPELTTSSMQISANTRVKYSTFVYAAFFIIANLACCWYYIAFPLVNMRPVHGYPAAPAVYSYHSTRYISVEYWMVWFLAWNILLVNMLCHALMNNTLVEFGGIHRFLSRCGVFWNGAIFLILSFLWLLFCNGGSTPGALCNDPRWCGVYYAEPAGADWCPNTVNFVPDVTVGDLYRSDEFLQAWMFSIFFFLWAMANKEINGYLRKKGLFREVFVDQTQDQQQQPDEE